MNTCLYCGAELNSNKKKYCNDAHRKRYERDGQTRTIPDNKNLITVNLSEITSELELNKTDLKLFHEHIRGLAHYENVWINRFLPGGEIYNAHEADPKYLNDMIYKHQLSEKILHWIADKINDKINELQNL